MAVKNMDILDELIQKGWNLKDSGKFEHAIDEFNEALRVAPNSTETKTVYVGRGLSYMGIYEYASAIEDFETALKIDPNYTAAIRGLKIAKEKYAQNPVPKKPTPQKEPLNNQADRVSRNYEHIVTNVKKSKYPLMSFSREYFMILYEISLWLILIGSAIGFAGFLGNAAGGYGFHWGFCILGFIIGVLIGLGIIGLSGGVIAVFLRMAEDVEKIKHSQFPQIKI